MDKVIASDKKDNSKFRLEIKNFDKALVAPDVQAITNFKLEKSTANLPYVQQL